MGLPRDFVVFDTETTGLDPMQAELCGISLCCRAGEAWYVPTRSPKPKDHLDQAQVIEVIGPLLEDPDLLKIAHNLKFDMNVMRRAGVLVRGRCFDTMIASFVTDSSRSSHSMNALNIGRC